MKGKPDTIIVGTGMAPYPTEWMRERVATLTRERDEARAELALAYTRALQAAASVVLEFDSLGYVFPDDELELRDDVSNAILALTPEDIDRIAQEAEHG